MTRARGQRGHADKRGRGRARHCAMSLVSTVLSNAVADSGAAGPQLLLRCSAAARQRGQRQRCPLPCGGAGCGDVFSGLWLRQMGIWQRLAVIKDVSYAVALLAVLT